MCGFNDCIDDSMQGVVADGHFELEFGRKSTTYSAPRYSSVWPFADQNLLLQ